MVILSDKKINTDELLKKLNKKACGAILTFYGIVRSPNLGKDVLYLEYEAYVEMAGRVLNEIEKKAKSNKDVTDVVIYHRLGRVFPEEISLFCGVSSVHRAGGFECLRFIVESIKHSVPIWKKEIFTDGSKWVEGHIIEELL